MGLLPREYYKYPYYPLRVDFYTQNHHLRYQGTLEQMILYRIFEKDSSVNWHMPKPTKELLKTHSVSQMCMTCRRHIARTLIETLSAGNKRPKHVMGGKSSSGRVGVPPRMFKNAFRHTLTILG
jgi:hypothetical protein